MESFDRDYFAPWSSTYFHRRVIHLTALQALRLGAWSAVMWVHHQGRATTSEEPARPPEGSFFAATGGRRRRLTMSRHRRRAASYPEAAKRRSYVAPSYESKYSARAAWRCRASAKGRNDATAQKNPAIGRGKSAPRRRCDTCPMLKHRAPRRAWPNEPICAHQIDSYLPRTALDTQMSPLQSTVIVSPWINRIMIRTAAIPAIIAP